MLPLPEVLRFHTSHYSDLAGGDCELPEQAAVGLEGKHSQTSTSGGAAGDAPAWRLEMGSCSLNKDRETVLNLPRTLEPYL